MGLPPGKSSPGGVWIADDFRDNLIIDRHDPVFSRMRASKIEHLRSENSEDAVTWNVFRSLKQIASSSWLPILTAKAFGGEGQHPSPPGSISIWSSVPPPPSLRDQAREGNTEADIIIESASWVWFIEAKYRNDISLRTKANSDRNQILRNLDVGSHYAGDRDFSFSLLILDPSYTQNGIDIVQLYQDRELPRQLLAAHRPDGLKNWMAISLLTWADLADVLQSVAASAPGHVEPGYAARALEWMVDRWIVDIAV